MDNVERATAEASKPQSIAQAANDLRIAAGEKVREIAQSIESKTSSLKEKAREATQQFRENATVKAGVMRDKATERAAQFRTVASEQWVDARYRAKELQVTTEDYIRQNPGKSVMIAVGVGFLMGLIIKR